MSDPIEQALLAEIREHPDDDAPRLVYADALMARGEPRGELIAAAIHGDNKRVDELWYEHAREWMSVLPAGAAYPDLDRGMISGFQLVATLADVPGLARYVLALAPVPVIRLRKPQPVFRELAPPPAPDDVINVYVRIDGRVAALIWCSLELPAHRVEIVELPSLRVIASAHHPIESIDTAFHFVAFGDTNRIRFARDRDALTYDLVVGRWAGAGPDRVEARRSYELAFTL